MFELWTGCSNLGHTIYVYDPMINCMKSRLVDFQTIILQKVKGVKT